MLAFFKTMRMKQTHRCILHIGQPVFIKEPVSFFSLKWYYLCLRGKSSTPTILIFYLVKINQKLFHNSRNNFWRLFFILTFGIDSVFQNHAIEINREMYKNIDTPIKFLRNNEFLFLLNINFILQISIMTPKVI